MIKGIGWATILIAVLTLICQVVDFIFAPAAYRGVAFISFNPDVPGCAEAYDELCAKPSFIYSPKILIPVMQILDLPTKWGHKYDGNDYILTLKDTYKILIGRIVIFPSRNHVGPAELYAYADDPKEAMDIANSIAYQYRDYFQQKGYAPPISIVDETNGKLVSRWKGIFPSRVFFFFMIALFIGLGIVLICWGRKFPPPLPVGQVPETAPISKY